MQRRGRKDKNKTNPQIKTHSIERAKIKKLHGNSLDFIFQNRIMDVYYLELFVQVLFFNKSNLEKIQQREMNPV